MTRSHKVSMYVITYNQVEFVEAAIRGALAQRYGPIEIVISDDASSDGTWDRIRRVVCGYTGPHRVVTRQSAVRRGIGGHVWDVVRACSGDWIVASAGDDVSHPDRVGRVMEAVERLRHAPSLVVSELWETDEHLNVTRDSGFSESLPVDQSGKKQWCWSIADRIAGWCPTVHGASMAFHRRVIDKFQAIDPRIIFEDVLVALRAEMLSGAALIRDPLVWHRNHQGQATNVYPKHSGDLGLERQRAKDQGSVALAAQGLLDLKEAFDSGWIGEDTWAAASATWRSELRRAQRVYARRWMTWPHRVLQVLRDPSSITGRGWRREVALALLPRPILKRVFGPRPN